MGGDSNEYPHNMFFIGNCQELSLNYPQIHPLSVSLVFNFFQIKDCAVKLCNWTEEQEKAEIVLANLLKKLEKASDLGQFLLLQKLILKVQ